MRLRTHAFLSLSAVLVLAGAFGLTRPVAAIDCELGGTDCDPGFVCDTLHRTCNAAVPPPEASVPSTTPPSTAVPPPAAPPCDITGSVDGEKPCAGADISGGGFNTIVGTGGNGTGAVGLIFANICSDPKPAEGKPDACNCRAHGQCSLDDVLQVFVNITIFILGISGSIILLMFVYGAFLWITSRGEAKRVEKGKDTITHAVIGFAIIILAYSMINFLVAALAGDTPASTIPQTIDNASTPNPTP